MRLLMDVPTWLAFAVVLMLGGAGCSKAPTTGTPPESLVINFEARVGEHPYSCASDGADAAFGDGTLHPGVLKLYVHEIELTLADGSTEDGKLLNDAFWQTDNVALLDFEDGKARCRGGSGEINTKVVIEKPSQPVTALAFSVGVPFEENHADPAKSVGPLTYTSMHWSWKAGYKFLRLDGKTADGEPYGLHLGSTGCEGSIANVTSCARPNRPRVELPKFNPVSDTVVLDVAALVSAAADETGGGNFGCLGEKTQAGCVPVFRQLGLDFDSGEPTADQSVFLVE
jgi:uncharacterized repeat protein (TIGR04052 family)